MAPWLWEANHEDCSTFLMAFSGSCLDMLSDGCLLQGQCAHCFRGRRGLKKLEAQQMQPGPARPEQEAPGMRLVLPTAPLRSEAAPPPRGLWVARSPLASTLWAMTGTRDALVLVLFY